MRTFEELSCWQKTVSLRKKLSILVKTFPREEKYRLVEQIIRASRRLLQTLQEDMEGFTIRNMFNSADNAEVPCMRS